MYNCDNMVHKFLPDGRKLSVYMGSVPRVPLYIIYYIMKGPSGTGISIIKKYYTVGIKAWTGRFL